MCVCVCAGVVPAHNPKIRSAPFPSPTSLLPCPFSSATSLALHMPSNVCPVCVLLVSFYLSPPSLPSQLTPCRICSVCHASFCPIQPPSLACAYNDSCRAWRFVPIIAAVCLRMCVCPCSVWVCAVSVYVCVYYVYVCVNVCVCAGICAELNET